MDTFYPLVKFSGEKDGKVIAEYVPGLSYRVRPGNTWLAEQVNTWVSEGKVVLDKPVLPIPVKKKPGFFARLFGGK